MRKVIMLILFTFLFIPFKSVKAINTYDLPINKDIRVNNVNKKFKWYKLKEVDSRNGFVFEHSCEYLELKETDFTGWSEERPEEKYGRIIEEKEIPLDEGEKTKYRKIIIDNIYSPSLHVKEIRLYDEDSKELGYTPIACNNCINQVDLKNLNDNNYSTTFETRYGSTIQIILDEETSCNIRVHIFYEHEDAFYGFRVSAFDIDTGKTLYQKEETLSTLVKIYSPAYESYRNSKTLSWFNEKSIKYYRYKDSYLICYEKEYLDDYYENVDGYIKDENSYIKEYNYEEVIPKTVEKQVEVFKEIIVPKEKIVNKYITVEKESNKDSKTCEYESKEKTTSKKLSLKIYAVFSLFLSLIVVLCLFLKELIKRCR